MSVFWIAVVTFYVAGALGFGLIAVGIALAVGDFRTGVARWWYPLCIALLWPYMVWRLWRSGALWGKS